MLMVHKAGKTWQTNAGNLPRQVKAALTALESWARSKQSNLTDIIFSEDPMEKQDIPNAIEGHIEAIREIWASLTEAERISIGHIRVNCQTGGATTVDRPESTRGKEPGGLRL